MVRSTVIQRDPVLSTDTGKQPTVPFTGSSPFRGRRAKLFATCSKFQELSAIQPNRFACSHPENHSLLREVSIVPVIIEMSREFAGEIVAEGCQEKELKNVGFRIGTRYKVCLLNIYVSTKDCRPGRTWFGHQSAQSLQKSSPSTSNPRPSSMRMARAHPAAQRNSSGTTRNPSSHSMNFARHPLPMQPGSIHAAAASTTAPCTSRGRITNTLASRRDSIFRSEIIVKERNARTAARWAFAQESGYAAVH